MTRISETRLSEASIESRCFHRLFADLVAVATKKRVRYYGDHVEKLRVLSKRGHLVEPLGPESYTYHRMLRSVVRIELAAGRPAITSALLYKPGEKERQRAGDPLGGQFFTILEEFYGLPIPKALRTERWIKELSATHAFWSGLSPAEVKGIMREWARANVIVA